MIKKLILATMFATVTTLSASAVPLKQPAPPTQSPIIQASDGEYCDWFAVINCSRKHGKSVRRAAKELGGEVIKTDNVDNFRNGWYCAVIGPSGRTAARRNRNDARAEGYKSAYIKEGCNY